ncbi:MAG TPA: type II secretion system F family protein [Gemmataceae bacterium]|nr:type II secretion system F family protein [Gemmataceae bacterium]
MSEENLLPFLAAFGGAAVLFIAAWVLISTRLARKREEMRRRFGEGSEPVLTLTPPAGRDGGLLRRFDAGFQEMIARTGLDMDAALALGLVLFCGVALAATVFVWRYEEEPWLAFPAFFLGAAVPLVFFWWRQQVWRRTLQGQLPDALFLLARSMRAGRSIDQAMQLVGEQGVAPLSKEFARMHQQMELGLSLGQALQIAARRLNLVDFNVFASVLSLHRSTGGNLPVILDRLANATRDRNQFEGQYRAATVLGRYSAAFIVSLACVILVYLFFFQRDWATRFFDVSQGYTGVFLFCLALGLELAGGLLLYLFLKHDY